jgi:aryl-alcohol dehydrogenase-like predicted oxidoreductase
MRGECFWDTADKYGDSEDLLGQWFAANPEKRKDIFLATKFGIRPAPDTPWGFTMDSTPEYCQSALDASLKRLGLPYVDLYYVHRVDKKTPIELTMRTMVELKNAGKIKNIGLSECSAETLRRAHTVHPITAIQVEYSLLCTEIESPQRQLLKAARELGVAIVAYSPLANGFLTGKLRSQADVSKPGDSRGILPWLSEDHIENNVAVVDRIAEMAKTKGITTPQLALAWLLAQGDDIFPIPGSSSVQRLKENLDSMFVSLSEEEEKTLRGFADCVVGDRFQEKTGYAYGDTPALE